jgi:hypothetical protein
MSIELLYPFTTPANYTFDTDVIEVAGGKAKLKDQRPADSTFHANYNADINGNWGAGVLTGTPVGGAAVSGGELDLTGGTVKYVDYAAAGNANHAQRGCIRAKYRPNYNGSPPSAMIPFCICSPTGSDNYLAINNLGGNWYMQIYDATGTLITNTNLGAWSAVSGTVYELELNWSLTTGESRLFIDGVQFGPTITDTGTRDTTSTTLRIGNPSSGGFNTEFKIDDVVVFSKVQHTANYTPDQPIPATIYAIDNPQLICNATFRHEGIDAFVETKTAEGSDQVKYILKKGTVKYYWTGSAWDVSDGTYGQSNTAAAIEANKATFTDTAVTTEVIVLLHSDNGTTTPELDVLQIDYDFSGSNPDSIDTCIVWGFQVQTDGDPDVATITVYLVNDAVQYKTNITIMRETHIVTPDSNGYWEIELVETANMEGTQRYAFEIGGDRFDRQVPDEVSANFYELN